MLPSVMRPQTSLDGDLVVYTAAINKNNAELKEALRRHIPIVQRSGVFGLSHKFVSQDLAAAGTHGKKQLPSSMLSLLLLDAGLDPSVSIGGTLKELGGNYRIGNSDYFVTEACEYVDSFLKSHHDIAIISNVEPDHLDYLRAALTKSDILLNFAKNFACGRSACSQRRWQRIVFYCSTLSRPCLHLWPK